MGPMFPLGLPIKLDTKFSEKLEFSLVMVSPISLPW